MAKQREPDKLARDAAAALAAGMSYGKWRAMQEQLNPPPQRRFKTCRKNGGNP